MTQVIQDDPLPDLRKRQIQLEENYRSTIREELEKAAKPKNRVSGFLNSGFGLWLLSALFVSAAGSVYTDYQTRARAEAQATEAKRAEEKKIKELTQRIDLEISYRMSLALARLEAANRDQPTSGARLHQSVKTALEPLTRPMGDSMPPLFPEFRAYSGLALIAELRRHVPDGEGLRLRKVLASLTGLVATVDAGQSGRPRSAHNVAGDLISIMKSARWDNGFHYTDCSKENPFC